MASSFGVTITAKDSASGTLASINKRLASATKAVQQAQAPFTQLAANATKFAQVTGISRVASSLSSVARSGFSAFQAVARIVEPLAAISGAASIAGMMRLATSWANFGTQLGNAANRAGLTSTQLMTLENAGRLAGVSADAMASGMTNLRDNMVNAVGGKSPQVIGMLQALGLSMDDARRFAGDTTKALPELADKIAGLRDPTLQAQVATTLFGGAGEAMLPFLRKGSAGIADYTEKVRKYGLLNDDAVAAANSLREAQATLTMSVEGLGYSVAQKLAPVITPLLQQMADWIAANRDWIAQGIGDKVQQFASYLASVNWAKVGQDVDGIYQAVKHLVDGIGGIVPAAELVVGFMGAAWLAKMMLPIVAITKALTSLPGKAAVAAAEAEAKLAGPRIGGGLLGGLARAAGMGLLEGVLSGQMGRDGAANLDRRDAAAANPPLPEADTRAWYERFYKPGPGLFSGWFGSGPTSTAPNGVPRPGPVFGPQQGGGIYPGPGTQGTGTERNIRNSNPTNLTFVGQPGAVSDGRFAKFQNMETGVAADLNQFLLYQDRDHLTSIAGMINKATPIAENPGVRDYIDRVSRQMGVSANDKVDLHNPDVAKRFILAVSPNEGGTPDAGAVERGVRLRLGDGGGAPLSLPANAGTAAAPGSAAAPIAPTGQVNVGVRFENMPAGARTTAVQSGTGLGPLRVERTDVGYGNSRDY